VIADLRRENRATFTASSALKTLKEVNEKLFTEIKTMRSRMLRAEENALRFEAQLNHPPLTSRPQPDPPALERDEGLLSELNELRVDRARVMRQLQDTEDKMGRMLLEKP